jgi:hypothetical protein
MFGCLQVAHYQMCSVFANCICFHSRFRRKNLEGGQARQRSKIWSGKSKVIENQMIPFRNIFLFGIKHSPVKNFVKNFGSGCFQCISLNLFIISCPSHY